MTSCNKFKPKYKTAWSTVLHFVYCASPTYYWQHSLFYNAAIIQHYIFRFILSRPFHLIYCRSALIITSPSSSHPRFYLN
uniref:Uncharacterized protein n=1 Tax=Pararge aegeria TaxID=116150 RepID=S4P2C2_9NEOP